MGLRLLVRVVFGILSESLYDQYEIEAKGRSGLTLKMMKSSMGTMPDRTVSPRVVK
jgi:hypothetical protein